MSGLATAERLTELGIDDIEVFERDSEPGGLAKSFSWGDFEFNDLGPHIWHTPNPALVQEWKLRFGDLLHEGKFFGQNIIGSAPGQFFDYPLSNQTLKQLPTSLRSKIEGELSLCNKEEQIKATSFDEYVEALVGPTLKNMFFKTYPEKLWGIPTSEMTANWAPKRIRFTKDSEEFHGTQWAAVGKFGSGSLIQSIYNSCTKKGVRFNFGCDIDRFEFENTLITAIISKEGRRIDVGPQDRIISTIPFNFLAARLGLNNSLTYRGALLVYVALNRNQAIPGKPAFLYFPQKDVVFHRLSEQKKFCDFGWPKGRTTLTAEIAFDEHVMRKLNEGKISEQVVEALSTYGFILKSDIADIKTVPLPNVYPILTKNNEIEFRTIYAKIKKFNQVYCVGTSGEFHYADLQILYQKGRDLAERVVEERMNLRIGTAENKKAPGEYFFSYFENNRPFVITEIGLNHGGSLTVAKDLLLAAKKAGVHYVKFQTYKSESRISQAYRSNNYSEKVLDTEETLFDMFKKCEFNESQWIALFDFAKHLGLKMFSAVFDLESLELLESLGCPAYKIASMDLNNFPLVEAIARTGKPIVLSTGMSSLGEIERSVKIIQRANVKEFIILHCVSSYPADKASLNLRAMDSLNKAFGQPVGFSDHSIGIQVPIIATSIGAVCVEKHFTLDRTLEGPDHIFSLDTNQMSELVQIIEEIPDILGKSSRLRSPQEEETSFKFKKSIHAKRKLAVGKVIEADDIVIKGPYGGIPPEFYGVVIGRRVSQEIEFDFPITWAHL